MRWLILLFCFGLSFCTGKVKSHTNHVVEIRNMKFVPETILINEGDTVTWVNHDFVDHDITGNDRSWSSGAVKKGASWSKVVSGNVNYFCSIHVVMKGEIRVN